MGMRLGAIIHILRRDEGYNIANISKTSYAEYKLMSVDGKLNL
jgi:hypothetical protein